MRSARAGHRAARVLLAFLVACSAARAAASCCVFEDPLVAISDASARGGDLRVGLDVETLSSRAAMAGMGHLEEVRQRTLRLTASYGLLDRVNVVLAVPFASREWNAENVSSHATGLGDLEAGVRVAVWRRVDFVPHPTLWGVPRAQALALSAGTSLPTGESDLRRGGVRLDEHAQLGTGGYGPYLGALYRLQQDPWELVASASARVRTVNAHGYQYARGLLAGAEVQRRVGERFSLGGGLDVRWASADRQDGVAVENSGGVLLSGIVSASVRITDRASLRLRAAAPIASRLDGDQRPQLSTSAGVQLDL
ncbi:hypothetical protein [Anaeromyxobacter paludicola]|uniref:Transporter n=1 Tax=Anaeromyxobacter paludicola TaxID=2918171 RepID=A0ABM7XFT5_9BACT|nr:hypothetical protein [Anaeromyxobacter paludicola]BDG10771.1 hypothetical protein AMPC_38840 [Anaeromyxobacter paludicola]